MNAKDYQPLLEQAGFDAIRVEDISADSLDIFRKQFSLFLAEKKATDEIDEATAAQIRELLPASHFSARYYVIFSAYKKV